MLTQKIFISLVVCFFSATFLFSQNQYFHGTYYGVTANNFYSGSGHGYSFAVSANANTSDKSYELGVIYNPLFQKMSGTSFRFKHFIRNKDFYFGRVAPYHRKYRMRYYFHYNLQYFSTEVKHNVASCMNEYMSIEHYAGVGVQFSFAQGLYLDTNVGIGGYISSSSDCVTGKSIGIHNSKHGFTANFDIGIGYHFF